VVQEVTIWKVYKKTRKTPRQIYSLYPPNQEPNQRSLARPLLLANGVRKASPMKD
jgi:hypothetical protein